MGRKKKALIRHKGKEEWNHCDDNNIDCQTTTFNTRCKHIKKTTNKQTQPLRAFPAKKHLVDRSRYTYWKYLISNLLILSSLFSFLVFFLYSKIKYWHHLLRWSREQPPTLPSPWLSCTSDLQYNCLRVEGHRPPSLSPAKLKRHSSHLKHQAAPLGQVCLVTGTSSTTAD